jgi:hypothetical protein
MCGSPFLGVAEAVASAVVLGGMTVMIFIPSLHLDSLPLPTPWPQNPLTLEFVILNGIFSIKAQEISPGE